MSDFDSAYAYTGHTVSGREVTLGFEAEEYSRRLARTGHMLRERGLGALLVFAQESHLYLTGFDTAGYVFFQCGVITADGRAAMLLTRRPDQAQALAASLYEDVVIWYNAVDENPAADLKRLLDGLGLAGERIGVELATYGLTGANWERVRTEVGSHFLLEDASDIVRTQRLRKSPAELALVRRAAALADDAVAAMVEAVQPGVPDSLLTAEGMRAMLLGGGDMPAGGPMVNSGPRATFGRGFRGSRLLTPRDQIIVELAASYHRYNVCIEHTIVIGSPSAAQERMHACVIEGLTKVMDAARAGTPIGHLDDVHRATLDRGGYHTARFSACGYSLGATYRPTWMDAPPMIYSGNPLLLEAGMVLFVHIMLGDTDTGNAAGVGETFVITESGPPERLSRITPQLFRK
ncbi:MAG: Xaa-Pro peptidase family protein [Gluconacetobacter sp.]|uniref:Aminopeptidase P family protein n=1 Tax=Gluconacetobacter dulcium TaxID=2729096 RepID=A0A7W4JYQ6_9PROT|nr:Xaa-Pro peptidase family protein [Gluconacetobacter dulcium]MBB2197115.1 aminopeptidase P family protein [Gluconacetobacter dulcium]